MACKVPKVVPSFDINDGGTVRRYSEGKIHNLNLFTTNVTEHHFEIDSGLKMENSSEEIIENDDINTTFYIDITLKFRLLRTTYLWEYFFSSGILSMYHTCGQDLP